MAFSQSSKAKLFKFVFKFLLFLIVVEIIKFTILTVFQCMVQCVCVCVYMCVLVAQSCPTLCDPPGSSVRGILQARILEWVTIPFIRRSS